MKQKTPERQPENPQDKTEIALSSLDVFKRERDTVAALKQNDPQRQEKIANLYVKAAESLDREMLAEHALKFEQNNPKVLLRLQKLKQPYWDRINHEQMAA